MTLSNQALPVCRYGWEYGWRGVVASTALLAERMVVLWRRMRELPIEEHDGVKVALVDDNMSAFSFGCRIVVGTVSYTTRQLAPMNIHEPTFRTDLGISSDLLDCRLSLYLNLKDVFGSVGEQWQTTNPYYQGGGQRTSNSQYISFGLTHICPSPYMA